MAISTIAGYPRIGRDRELKWATERYWAGKTERKHAAGNCCGASHRALAGPARRRHRPGRGQRLLVLRSDARHERVARRHSGAIWERTGRSRYLLPHGARRTQNRWRCRARHDQVVRHQLPLSGSRASSRSEPSRSPSDKPFAELAEAQALGLNSKVDPHRPAHLPSSRCNHGRSSGRCLLAAAVPAIVRPLVAAGRRLRSSSTSRSWSRTRTMPLDAALNDAYKPLSAAAARTRLILHVPLWRSCASTSLLCSTCP